MSAALICPGVGTLVLPWWPETITRSGRLRTWSETARPGDLPLLLSDGMALEEYQISYLARSADLDEPVTEHVATLHAIAASLSPVSLLLEQTNRGLFHLTELSIAEVAHATTGDPTAVDVSATLKQASEATVNVGPVPRKKNKKPAKAKK